MSPPPLPVAVDDQSPLKGRGAILVQEEARRAKTQAREAVVLLEQARTLLYEDNAGSLPSSTSRRQLLRPTDGQLC